MADDTSPAIGPIENHRRREKGILVYPVYSRRSGGLSVGINLFPAKKVCPFDCPYCEVFPFTTDAAFNPSQMEDDLRASIVAAEKQKVPVRDICFSGNGEPSLSPDLPEALERAGRVRGSLVPAAKLVLITNGAGLLEKEVFSFLAEAVYSLDLDIWLKLDAGTPAWYEKINRSSIPFDKLLEKIRKFTSCVPVTIQTMLCAIESAPPPHEEERAWEALVVELAGNGKGLRKVQVYGKARPAPEDPKAQALPLEYLRRRSESLESLFTQSKNTEPRAGSPPVEVFP